MDTAVKNNGHETEDKLEAQEKLVKKGGKGMNTTVKTNEHETEINEHEMGDQMEVLEKLDEIMVEGETSIDDDVVAAIAGVAAQEVEGVASMGTASIQRSISEVVGRSEKRSRGVEGEHGKKEAIVDLTLKVNYGFSIPEIIIQVRKNVAMRLLDLCGLIVKEVNITIAGIEFPEKVSDTLK